MGSLFSGKTKAVSNNPPWLDAAGEEVYNLAKSFIFKPKSQGSTAATGSQPTASATPPSATGGVSTYGKVYDPAKGMWVAQGSQPTATSGQQGGAGEYDVSMEGLRELPQFTGQRFAPVDSSIQTADDLANAVSRMPRGFKQGRGLITEAAQGYGKEYNPTEVNTSDFNENYLAQWLDPYLKTALQTTSDEMMRASNIDRLRQQSGMTSRKSFGGSRQAIEDSELTRNTIDRIGAMFKTGMSEGFDRATGNYQTEAARKLNAGQFNESQRLKAFDSNRDQFTKDQDRKIAAARGLADLAATESNISSQDVDRLMRTGAIRQDAAQRQKDFEFENFLEQRDLPFTQLERLSGIIGGSPSKGSRTVTQQPSILSQIAGATAAGVGAYKTMK